ncbi:MAG: hypothetical protein ABTQ25_02485 [Nitrosomonas ureae]
MEHYRLDVIKNSRVVESLQTSNADDAWAWFSTRSKGHDIAITDQEASKLVMHHAGGTPHFNLHNKPKRMPFYNEMTKVPDKRGGAKLMTFVNARIEIEHFHLLQRIGGGNLSAGLRLLCEERLFAD